MANILYLGSTPLIDLSAYATTSYVDTAVSNVDVTDQLSNYVLKDGDKVLSDNNFTDALKSKLDNLSNFDPTDISTALSTIQSTLADITDDSEEAVQSTIDTWTEIKNFLQDYDNTDSLSSIISATSSQIQTWVGQQGFLKANDVSTFVTQNDLQGATTAIGVLDTSVNAIEADVNVIKADYVKSNDISTFITAADVPTVPTTVSSFTNDAGYYTATDVANDTSTKVESTNKSVMNILSISQADFNALATKDPSTLYIVL